MNIDWFTFTAQIVNFLLLVALLRWFLYGPIVRAMQEREDKIAGRLEEADQKLAEAQEKFQEYEESLRQIDLQREQRLKQARHDAHAEHQRLLKEAKQEIDRRREQWRNSLHRDREELLTDLRRQAGKMGLHAARHTLQQLADAELEQRMCNAFASRLQQLGDQPRREIQQHLDNGEAEVSMRSAFEMSSEQRARIQATIRETFQADANISFERAADLICGLELDVGGYSFGWNVKEFLRDMEVEFFSRLKE